MGCCDFITLHTLELRDVYSTNCLIQTSFELNIGYKPRPRASCTIFD